MKATPLPAGSFSQHHWKLRDSLPWLLAAAVFYFFDGYLALGTVIIIMIIACMSLNLVLGYAGVETLGHAAFFGIGAYTAGLYAIHVSTEPISGLLAAAVVAAVFGMVSGYFLLRMRSLTLLMLTLAVGMAVYEFANKWSSVTGGDDGLSGISPGPLFGVFDFGLDGRTGYLYALGVLVLVFLLVRTIVDSPFGLSLRGIRENISRMKLVGAPVTGRLVIVYSLSGAIAGMGGALYAQTIQVVGLESLSFDLSSNLLIMVVLGGLGRLYGPFVGAIIFLLVQDRAAAFSPQHWMFAIGLILILSVRFSDNAVVAGIMARLKKVTKW